MKSSIDAQHFDYVLYKYVEYLVKCGSNDETLMYHSELIRYIKKNLDRRNYMIEEEMVVKYLIYVIWEKIINGFFNENIGRLYRIVFEYFRLIDPVRCRTRNLQRYLLWSYSFLTESNFSEIGFFLKLEGYKYEQMIEDVMRSKSERRKDADGSELLSEHCAKLQRLIHTEIKHIYEGLSRPLLIREPKPVREADQAKTFTETMECLQRFEMLAAELVDARTGLRPYTGIYFENIAVVPENRYISALFKERNCDAEKGKIEDSDVRIRLCPGVYMGDCYAGKWSNTKGQRSWTQEEEKRLMDTVDLLRKDWKRVRKVCNLEAEITIESLKEKYYSILGNSTCQREL